MSEGASSRSARLSISTTSLPNCFCCRLHRREQHRRRHHARGQKVSFSGHTFPALTRDFGKNAGRRGRRTSEDVDVVPRNKGMLRGVVTSVTFLGVHYEIIVDVGGFQMDDPDHRLCGRGRAYRTVYRAGRDTHHAQVRVLRTCTATTRPSPTSWTSSLRQRREDDE